VLPNKFETCPEFEPSTAVVTFDAFFSYTLSTGELAYEGNVIKLYPNPNNEHFTIELGDLQERGTLQVHDLTGRLVYQTLLTAESEVFDVHLENSVKGMYLLTLSRDQQRRFQRFAVH